MQRSPTLHIITAAAAATTTTTVSFTIQVLPKVTNTVWSSRGADEPIAHRASANYQAFWVNFHGIARLIKLN